MMKNIHSTNAPSTSNVELPSIETASLDDVTGGCGACGQNCAAGPAPTAQPTQTAAPRFNPFSAFARR